MKRIALLLFFIACLFMPALAQVDIEFGKVEWCKAGRFIDFKLMRDGKKVPLFGLKPADGRCYELANSDTVKLHIDSLVDISSRKLVSNNLTIVILADQGVLLSEEDYMKVKEAIVTFVDALPEYVKVYITMMGTDVTETERVYPGESIRSYVRRDEMAEQSEEEKSIYASIISKIQEIANLDEDECFYPDIPHNKELSSDTLSDKMLFILSGKVEQDEDEDFFRDKLLFNNPDYLEIPEHLKAIYCVYFGEELDQDMENEFKFMCHRTPEGRFYPQYSVDSLKYVLLGAIDSIAMDYRMYYTVEEKTTYNGQPLNLCLDINKAKAHGEKSYSIGSALRPIVLSPAEHFSKKGWYLMILTGFLIGLGVIILVYLIMQLMVPWLQYKWFRMKYVKKFKPSDVKDDGKDVVLQQCYYCKDNFQEGDLIVTKCKHTVHWECWEENHDRCPEYGLNSCKDGIYYYNKKHLLDERNSPYFTSWLLYGLAGGLISWLLFKLIRGFGFFRRLVVWIVGLFEGANADLVAREYVQKIVPLLMCGLILGFVITFLFGYLMEFRKKTWKNMSIILARSLGNAVIGCIAFLLGAIVIIALKKPSNCWWIDWLPWLFFGISITWLLSKKSDIEFKEAFLGGLISAVLSFVVVYGLGSSVPIVSVLAFMIYAAGLGASIAVVHYTSENYYLHIEGPTKERDIAIYKWMNVAGGSNHVSIGSSPNCVIQMTWDPSDQIREKQVELYIDNDHPYCHALTDGTTYGNEQRVLKEGDSFMLSHGSSFTIGNTKFTYIEKDK
ncbi:MAG: hypothetical protein IKU00_09065 [Bacteroidales bacterium]|nr:hypothetical protein [Bacteroidales bacterium]